jgi:ribonuclease HII
VTTPTLDLEIEILAQHGFTFVAGLDEAGRGALAGPVTAAAVILPLNNAQLQETLQGVNDSKQLTANRRAALFSRITHHALAYGIASVAAEVIDEIGIIPATKQAMATAVSQLTPTPEFLLIDGRIRLKTLATPQQSVIRGDGKSLSIAAASILAKVTRDRFMIELDTHYPQYGFARHKGYGTPQHLAALQRYGPCPLHRYTFAPIKRPLL